MTGPDPAQLYRQEAAELLEQLEQDCSRWSARPAIMS